MRTLRYLFLDELAAMFDAEQRIVERAQANNNEERTKGKVFEKTRYGKTARGQCREFIGLLD